MNADFPIENRAGLPSGQLETLVQAVSRQTSIKHAVDWLATHRPPLTIEDMVTQDEFSHDILAPYPEGLYLVYDVT